MSEVTADQVAEYIAEHGLVHVQDELISHGKVAFVFSVQDVQMLARQEHGHELPEHRAKAVLREMWYRHDMSEGINWLVMSVHIDAQFEEMGVELEVNHDDG